MQYEFMPFYVGQKVVCVNDSPCVFVNGLQIASNGVCEAKKGVQYTVSAVNLSDKGTGWFCWLYELPQSDRYFGFHSSRFAPLEERFISLAEVIKIESPLTCVN